MPLPSAKQTAENPPPFISAPVLNAPHGFFGRNGGVSEGVYESLNAGLLTGDDQNNVRENQARIARTLGVDAVVTMKQVHGNICVIVNEDTASTDADAMVTTHKNIALGILTADCAPILFTAPGIIGAAHAGWGGALKGVIEQTIAQMEKLGANRADIRAGIGPCIAMQSYDVSKGFETPFIAEDPASVKFFGPSKSGGDKQSFDLGGYCMFRLTRAGIQNAQHLKYDTLALERDYFSHRRTTLAGGDKRGLQMSAITLV